MRSPRLDWIPVARWELRRVLGRKDFLVSTMLMPVILIGISFLMVWIERRGEDRVQRIAVVRADGDAVERAAGLPELEGFEWIALSGAGAEPEALRRAVREKRYDGAVRLPASLARPGEIEVVVRRERPGWTVALEEHLHEIARAERAEQAGLAPGVLAAIDEPVRLTETLAAPEARTSRGDRLTALVLMILMMVAILVTGAYLSVAITGEKQARVTEVIVSAVRPQSWIDGKIAAYTAIGALQAGIWALSLGGFALVMSWALPPSVNPGVLAIYGLFALLGLVFYVALYSSILATIKDLQSSSKFQAYLYFLPFLPLLFVEPVVENPDALWVLVLSLLPPFAPILMPTRFAVSGAAGWEVAVGLVLLAVAAWFMRLAAGHALRIGMLMYGKEITLPQLVRWARES